MAPPCMLLTPVVYQKQGRNNGLCDGVAMLSLTDSVGFDPKQSA